MGIKKDEIVFTFPGALGGVSSFNYNIINQSKLITSFYSRVILLKEESDKRPLFLDHFNTDEKVVFEYSDKENQFHLQKRLNYYLGSNAGAIVTDNGLTIEAATRFNNSKTVYKLIHDYYYVNQLVKLGDLVDVAIAHSSFFSDAVVASNPEKFSSQTFYIPYGVTQLEHPPVKTVGPLNLVYLGRLEIGKGVLNLFEIAQGLKKINIEVNWTIIGKGSLKETLVKQWENENVTFLEPSSTSEVYKILAIQDIFIFPTLFEGTPVAILECLANSVITIANDLPGGIRDVLKEGIGVRCKVNDWSDYIYHISKFNNDRSLLKHYQQNCFNLANEFYDAKVNADLYFELFSKWKLFRREEKSSPRKLLKLDKSIFPNLFTKIIRKYR